MTVDLQGKVESEAALARENPAPQLDAPWVCLTCGDRFVDRSAWASHRAREHGEKRLATAYILDGECPVCSRVFANRQKALIHVHYAIPVCLVNLILSHPRANPEDVEAADAPQGEAEHKLRAGGEHTT